jgi:hypothetical protein
MISVDFDAAPALSQLDEQKNRLRSAARVSVENGANRLLALVQGKLSGGVLNSRSGRLLRSIRAEVSDDAELVSARLFSDGSVPYARIQEYGGRMNIPAVSAQQSKALAFVYEGRLVFARSVAAHVVDSPERSYMRSSLDEFASTFPDVIGAAVAGATA